MNPSDESIAAVRAALSKTFSSDELAKSGITTATGANAYDLRGPAMLQVPVLTPLREKLGRVKRTNPGQAAHWKTIRGNIGSGLDSMGYIPEGQRSGVRSTNLIDQFSTYTTLGEEGTVSDQAVLAQLEDTDLLALDNMLTLWKTMQKEENSLLAGNRTLRLGTPATPAVSAGGTTATLTAATYYVAVVALTNEGFQVASVVNGVQTAVTTTGADGKTYTINGGTSNKSAISAGQAVTLGQALLASVTPIPGAVGYAWFVGTTNAAASLYLQALTTINSVAVSAPIVTTTQLASAITADCSYNDGTQAGSNPVAAYDGLMTSAMNTTVSGSYYYAMPTGTAGTGTALTPDFSGGIVELNNMIISMWNANKVQVDVLYMSANTLKNVTKTMLTGSNGNLLHIYSDADANRTQLVGGGRIKAYSSPVGSPYGGDDIAIMIHPNLPDGVILGWASQLPIFYRNNETPAVAQILTRQDYFGIEWPRRTRATEYGVYVDQCLAIYAPFAMGVITNINVT